MTNREPVARESANIAKGQQEKLRKLFSKVSSRGRIDLDKQWTVVGNHYINSVAGL